MAFWFKFDEKQVQELGSVSTVAVQVIIEPIEGSEPEPEPDPNQS